MTKRHFAKTKSVSKRSIPEKVKLEFRLNPDLSLPAEPDPNRVGSAKKRPWTRLVNPQTNARYYILPISSGGANLVKQAIVKTKPTVIVYNISEDMFKALTSDESVRPQKLGFFKLMDPVQYFMTFHSAQLALAEELDDFKTVMQYASKVGIPVKATAKDHKLAWSRELMDTFFTLKGKIGTNQEEQLKYRFRVAKAQWTELLGSDIEMIPEDRENIETHLDRAEKELEGKPSGRMKENIFNLQIDALEMISAAMDSIKTGKNPTGAGQRLTCFVTNIIGGKYPLSSFDHSKLAHLKDLQRQMYATPEKNVFLKVERQMVKFQEEATQLAYQIKILGDDPEIHSRKDRILSIVSPMVHDGIVEKLPSVTREDYDEVTQGGEALKEFYWEALKYYTVGMLLPCGITYYFSSLVYAEMLFGFPPFFILGYCMLQNYQNRSRLIKFYDHVQELERTKPLSKEEEQEVLANLQSATEKSSAEKPAAAECVV